MRVMPETCANIRCGTRKSRAMSPPASKNVAAEAKPIVTAVVTPKSIRTSTEAKMTNITMTKPPSYFAVFAFANRIKKILHFFRARQGFHLFVGGLHFLYERRTVGVRHMHPLLFKLFNDSGFPVTDFFSGEVLGVDGLFLQNRLQFLGHAVKEHLVDQKHLAIKVVFVSANSSCVS